VPDPQPSPEVGLGVGLGVGFGVGLGVGVADGEGVADGVAESDGDAARSVGVRSACSLGDDSAVAAGGGPEASPGEVPGDPLDIAVVHPLAARHRTRRRKRHAGTIGDLAFSAGLNMATPRPEPV